MCFCRRNGAAIVLLGEPSMKRLLLPLLVCAAATSAVALRAQAPVVPNPWTPPVGIPMPPFGITQVAGTPTHYVDNTHSGATDSSNPNGSPTKPRLTIPTTLSAGAVVEVRGGPYIISSQWSWTLNGTSSAPVFIKGINKPRHSGERITNQSRRDSYFVVEGLLLDDVRVRVVVAPLGVPKQRGQKLERAPRHPSWASAAAPTPLSSATIFTITVTPRGRRKPTPSALSPAPLLFGSGSSTITSITSVGTPFALARILLLRSPVRSSWTSAGTSFTTMARMAWM